MVYPTRFVVLTATLLIALIGVGIVHGFWTNRWASDQVSDEQMAAMENLGRLIKAKNDTVAWEGKDIPREQVREALVDSTKCLQRRYTNLIDGNSCSVLLTRGRPGPMVIKHLPTECYPSSGFELVGAPKRYLTSKASDEFWVATFKKTAEAFPLTVRVYWSWSGDGHWRAPDQPRMAFAKFQSIYKLYVIQTVSNDDDAAGREQIQDFVAALTDATRKDLFGIKN